MSHRSNAYATDADLERMEALCVQASAEFGPRSECAVGDLAWRMYRNATVDPAANIRLWCDGGGHLIGFAWFYPNGDLDVLIHPRTWCDALAAEVLAWAEERYERCRAIAPIGRPLTAWALASNEALSAALERAGLVRGDGSYLHLHRSLDGAIETPVLPPGYCARGVAGREEAGERAALHRRAFGSNRLSDDCYLRLMGARTYRADLDVVVVSPSGEWAALALAWLDERNATGEFEPVGTDPAHRRRGLARAAIQEGMRRLRARGATAAIVSALPDNAGSVELYRSLGFDVIDTNRAFVRHG
jgi:mycothiol synthase